MFSPANTKLKKLYKFDSLKPWLRNKRKVFSFDLLSGHSCPFALECFAKVVKTPDGKRIQDGPQARFRCYSASQEVIYANAYNKRKTNMESVRKLTAAQVCKLLMSEAPGNMGVCRIHAAGDFVNQQYFRGWMRFAENCPDVLFYAYTKCLPYWVNCREYIPQNVILTASRGGRKDDMIETHGLRSAVVVYSQNEANSLGLEIDRDDSHASDPNHRESDFALEIHGPQQAGSEAMAAWQKIKTAKKKGPG